MKGRAILKGYPKQLFLKSTGLLHSILRANYMVNLYPDLKISYIGFSPHKKSEYQ